MVAYREAENIPRAAYRVKEVALAIGPSKDAIYQQVKCGHIPRVKIGGRLFVPASYFEEIGLDEPVQISYPEGARLGIPEGYTVAQVAATLGAGIPNVYERTAEGVIPMYKEGARRLIPSSFFAEVGLVPPKIILAK